MNSGAGFLAVDDDRAIRKLIDVSLSSKRPHGGKREEHALSQFNNVRPDIVLLDLGLPDMEGGDVLAKIREKAAVPVIILTVKESDADKVRLLEAGADDYLTKPFSVKELTVRIRSPRHSLNLTKEAVFESGPLKIDFNARSVTVKGEP